MFHANRVTASQGWTWVAQGAELFARQPALWLAMAVVYLAIAIVLGLIPFVGWLLLVLLSPALLLGTLSVAKAVNDGSLAARGVPAPPASLSLRGLATCVADFLAAGGNKLFAGFSREEKVLPVMVVSTMLLGGVVVIRILAQLLRVGGSALPSMLSGVSASLWLPALLGLAVVLALYALLLMAFVYTVPLILFRGAYPLPAIESSFVAAAENWQAFGIFIGVFSLAGEAARLLFLVLSFPFDYFAFLALGLVLLPVMAGGLYASYLDLFTRRTAPRG
jgi:hypothetical protein